MRTYRINWCVTWGAVVAAAGTLLVVGWPSIFQSQLRRLMVLSNGSMSFGIWQEIPIPIYMDCYLYNITNVQDILAGKKVKLSVQQMGPYSFREIQTKVNITWNENGTVSYQTRRRWYFQPDRSNGSLSDIVTNINPIIATIAYILRNERTVLQMLANMIIKLHHSNMFLSANVSSWLFDGVEDPILTLSTRIPNLPYNIPFDKFGWLYTRNDSSDYDGWFVVNTGAEDFSRLGKIELWNHYNQTVYSSSCGEVRGTTGELWAPKKGQTEISLFASDICTTLNLAVSGPVTILGVEGTMFVANDSLFDNGQKYANKACYCEDSPQDCMLSGAMNVSACRYGAPAFVSLPHMRRVDPYYADKIDGMDPTGDYDFKMAIEMVTGMPLMVLAQLQVNVLVRHIPWLSINNQLPDSDLLVPMFWFREHIFVDGKYSSFAKMAVTIHFVMPYVLYIFTAMGFVLLSAGLWITKCFIPRRTPAMAESQTFLKNHHSNSN